MQYLKKVYHVTSNENFEKIKTYGLIPQIGILSQKIGENEEAIYCFTSEDEVDNALMNWLGDEYNELEESLNKKIDIAILELDVSHLKIPIQTDSNSNVFFEQKITEKISPEYITLLRIEESEFEPE